MIPPISDDVLHGLFASGGFFLIASLTLYFSHHRKAFIGIFVPRENWREVIRSMGRRPGFSRSTRFIAILQYGVAIVILIGCLVAWLW